MPSLVSTVKNNKALPTCVVRACRKELPTALGRLVPRLFLLLAELGHETVVPACDEGAESLRVGVHHLDQLRVERLLAVRVSDTEEDETGNDVPSAVFVAHWTSPCCETIPSRVWGLFPYAVAGLACQPRIRGWQHKPQDKKIPSFKVWVILIVFLKPFMHNHNHPASTRG